MAPEARAYSLRDRVIESIYKDPQPNWSLLADKLAEVSATLPWSHATSILLGNICLKANRAADAEKAYDRAWHQLHAMDSQRPEVERQLARLRAGEPLDKIPPLRSALLE